MSIRKRAKWRQMNGNMDGYIVFNHGTETSVVDGIVVGTYRMCPLDSGKHMHEATISFKDGMSIFVHSTNKHVLRHKVMIVLIEHNFGETL